MTDTTADVMREPNGRDGFDPGRWPEDGWWHGRWTTIGAGWWRATFTNPAQWVLPWSPPITWGGCEPAKHAALYRDVGWRCEIESPSINRRRSLSLVGNWRARALEGGGG